MSENKFSETMKRLADIQLYDIINSDPGDYDPKALIAAKEELKSRNLTFEEQEEVDTRIRERIAVKDEPLNASERIWFICTCWYPGSWTRTAQLMADGYETKSNEARTLMKKYVAFVFVGIILFFILFS